MEQNMMLQGFAAMQTLQTTNGQTLISAAKNDPAKSDEFQKLLDQKSQTQNSRPKTESKTKETPKAESPKEASDAQQEPQEVQDTEDPRETVRKLVEMGVVHTMDAGSVYLAMEPVAENGNAAAAVQTVQTLENIPAAETAQPQQAVLQSDEFAADAGLTAQTDSQPQTQMEQNASQTAQAPKVEQQVKAQSQPEQQAVFTAEPEQEDSGEAELTYTANQPQAVFQNVEAAPIKVGEASMPEQSAQPQDVSSQLAGPLNTALAQGESRVEISLTPDHLGSVKVEITQSADGALHVALSAENSQTRSLLEKHAVNLQALLAGRNQEHVQVEVQRQEESQSQNPYDGHNGSNQNGRQQQEEQQQNRQTQHGQDFFQQLRLGLIPTEAEAI